MTGLYKIGLIKEGKVPPDRRVALTPEQCKFISENYKDVKIKVQTSDIRDFPDQEYIDAGIEVVADVSDCDILLGIKEVPIEQLISDKNYMFFSHTIKFQPYNRKLLQAIIAKNITLTDYEVVTDKNGKRLIGFGRYAGIVGCYNSFLAVGKKFNLYELSPAYKEGSKVKIEEELKKVKLPNNFKILLTGDGRVAGGALEIVEKLGIKNVTPQEYIANTYDEPVYTTLRSKDFYASKDGKPWDSQDFYANPEKYHTDFVKYSKITDLYIACHYWNPNASVIMTKEDLRAKDFKIKVIGDISCDVDGPIPSTVRASTIPDPIYGYNPFTEKEVDFMDNNAIGVMAVDNLPCELPRDASEDFGNEFINYVLPNLIGEDTDKIIERATIAKQGQLTDYYKHLSSMLED